MSHDRTERHAPDDTVYLRARVEARRPLLVRNLTKGTDFEATCDLTPRQARVLLAGGLLNHIKEGGR